MGSWFMKYNLPKSLTIEYLDKVIKIRNYYEINKIYNILVNLKYDSGPCDGVITHIITMNNEVYYLKEWCHVIEINNKQSDISKKNLKIILKIIDNNY